MEHVIIGVDPHKLSATIEVVDEREMLLGSGRFTTDRSGYAAMRKYVGAWPERVWAVEGSNGAGRMLTDRREALTRRRVQTVDRLQALLAELLPGQAKRDITTGQAKTMLAGVRPTAGHRGQDPAPDRR